MFHTAIKIGKGHYEYDKPLNIHSKKAFDTIRNSFASFGLDQELELIYQMNKPDLKVRAPARIFA